LRPKGDVGYVASPEATMTKTGGKSILVAAALAAFVAGMPGMASARRPKGVFMATVDGKHVKLKFNVSFTVGGNTVAILGVGQSRPRPRGLLRTLGFGCGDFPPAAVPGNSVFCTANYQETRVSRHPTTSFWAIPSADQQIHFDTYDGTTISGSFDLVLPPVNATAPIHIQAEFHGPVRTGL
jgi:hypothetical protein